MLLFSAFSGNHLPWLYNELPSRTVSGQLAPTYAAAHCCCILFRFFITRDGDEAFTHRAPARFNPNPTAAHFVLIELFRECSYPFFDTYSEYFPTSIAKARVAQGGSEGWLPFFNRITFVPYGQCGDAGNAESRETISGQLALLSLPLASLSYSLSGW